MEAKVFDFKVLGEKLAAKGLPMAEDVLEVVAKEVFAWTEESLAAHPNVYVKALGTPVIGMIKPLAFDLIDKTDGKVG